MKRGPILLMLALCLGATPALAQESPGVIPSAQPDAAPAKTIKRKPVALKPAAVKPAEQAQPAAPKLSPPRPAIAAAPAPAKTEPAPTPPAAAKTEATKPEPPQKPEQGIVAGIPPAERLRIQAALLWAGDYPSEANGNDPLQTAISNFRKRHKSKVAGPLTPSERADLAAAARSHEDEFGWHVVVDPATGIRIGLPTKLVPHAKDAARGTHWSSAYGDVQVETFRIKDGTKLAALYEQQRKEPANRKIETGALRDDGFFLSGQQGLKRFSVRAKMRDGEIRGFTMLYDQMMETIVTPVMVAMASAFAPFPEQRMAPYAALAKRVEYGSGLVVSVQGHIVTDRKITEGCEVLVASGIGDALRVAVDDDSGLALLRVYGARNVSPLTLPPDSPKGGDVTLVGIADPKEQAGRKLTEVKARLGNGSAIELRQPVPVASFSGAAALDAQGQFLGMMQTGGLMLASIESSAPPVRLISAATIRGFLAAHDVQPAATQGADAKASVVRVICVRK
jgi:trypsin-like peptidase